MSNEFRIDGAILQTEEILSQFSEDASIFKIKPSAVIEPQNIEDIEKCVQYVMREREGGDTAISLTARSAGTDMSGGPLTSSLVLSFTKRINMIHDIGSDYVSVDTGAYYRDVEQATLEKGLVFPSYPASKDLCAIGGIVGNNAGGEKTLSYGKTVDYVREIDMICHDGHRYTFKSHTGDDLEHVLRDQSLYGEIHRKLLDLAKQNYDEIQKAKPSVTKNSAGYYLWEIYDRDTHTMNVQKLICGSQGTLGLMSRVTLALVPVAPFVKTIVIFLRDVATIPDIVHAVLPHKPESFELYDDHTFKIAMKFLPDIIKKMGGDIFSLGLQFIPEFIMTLTGGVPKIILIAEFTGQTEAEAEEKSQSAYASLTEVASKTKGIQIRKIKTQSEAKKYWTFRRESFNLLRSKLSGLRTAPFIEDVVIHADDFPTFLPQFERLLDEYNLTYTIAGHVGDGNLHVIPLMTLIDRKNVDTIRELSDKVYKLVSEFGGSITGEHNDGLIRTPFLHYMYSDTILSLFAQVKNIFDPQNIFNPGKKVGTTWEQALQFINRDR